VIVCAECGHATTPTESFCASCGTLLEWSGHEVSGGADPVARKPDVEGDRPRPVPLPVEEVHTGPYCSACGVRNHEGRFYCRSCGSPLRRLWLRIRGRRRFAAGERPSDFRRHDTRPSRPSRRRRFRLPRRLPIGRLGPVLVILGLLGIGLGPARTWANTHIFGIEQAAQNRLEEHYVSVTPVSATASSAEPGHAPSLAIDGDRDTYWASSATNAVGATLTIRFATPASIDQIGVLSGEPGAGYRADSRPETVKLAAGATSASVSLDDTANFQTRSVALSGVSELTVTITSTYAGQQSQAVALTEIELFSKA
jgi:hypothetical protein